MSALPVHAVVITRMSVYDHGGEIVPRGAIGTIAMVHVRQSGDADDTYVVELFGEGGRGRRVFTATKDALEVLAVPVRENTYAYA